MIIVSLKSNAYHQPLASDPNAFFSSGLRNWSISKRPHIWRPPTDVYETEDRIVIRVEIAGMSDEDISVSFDNHLLSISGNRVETFERRAYHQMEIPFGEFSTEVEILIPIESENISAQYQDGFLVVILPKAASRHIRIQQD